MRRPGRRADLARIEHLADAHQRRLEAEVLVDGEEDVRLLRRAGHRHRVLPVGGEGLLADRRDALRDRLADQRPVGVHARDDVEEVDLLACQHLVEIAIPMRHAEFARGGFGLGRVEVADGDELDALGAEVLPGIEMIARKEAAADEGYARNICH